MNNLPNYISYAFVITTFITLLIFYFATKKSKSVLFLILSWLIIQMVVSYSGFYTVTDAVPPRFIFLIFPPFLLIAILFLTKSGKQFLDGMNPKTLTLLHSVRIPVELVLFSLSIQKVIPTLMTFEGRNFDILSGLSAPLIYYWGFRKNGMNKKLLLFWNIICLVLLLNIVVNAIFSAPFPFQRFAFDQPNIAVLYFPFVWLPSCVVPLVLLSHLAVIRQVLKSS